MYQPIGHWLGVIDLMATVDVSSASGGYGVGEGVERCCCREGGSGDVEGSEDELIEIATSDALPQASVPDV